MNNTLRIILLLAVLSGIFSAYQTVQAACSGASPAWTTGGNEQTDLEECIAAASAGDTISVIAGDGETTWVKVKITKPLTIKGPGADHLTVKWVPDTNQATSNALMVSDVDDWQISGFTFQPTTAVRGYCLWIMGSNRWRVHHNTFLSSENTPMHVAYLGLTNENDISGLIDNNTIYDGRIYNTGNGGSPAVFQSIHGALWHNDYPLGMAGNGNAVYIEDNTFANSTYQARTNVLDANRGSRTVFRYNTVRGNYLMQHGITDTGRGPRTWEFYGNDLDRVNYLITPEMSGIAIRGGTGVIHYNRIVKYNRGIYFYDDRSTYNDTLRPPEDNTTVAGKCDGDNHNDGNQLNPATGSVDGWPCRDQVGQGADETLWTTVNSTPGPPQALQPAYLWSNYDDSQTMIKACIAADTNISYDGRVTGLTAAHIVANRDFFDYNPENVTGSVGSIGDNTTGGVGCGPARPATCTVDAAYFETLHSCSDPAGMTGVNPPVPISGTLYKCSAPNTWTAYYTPYTYPHPLRANTDTTPPAAPSALTVQ